MYNKSRRAAILHGFYSGTDCHTERRDSGGGARGIVAQSEAAEGPMQDSLAAAL